MLVVETAPVVYNEHFSGSVCVVGGGMGVRISFISQVHNLRVTGIGREDRTQLINSMLANHCFINRIINHDEAKYNVCDTKRQSESIWIQAVVLLPLATH